MIIVSDNTCFLLSVVAILDFLLISKEKMETALFVQLGYIDVRNHHQSKST